MSCVDLTLYLYSKELGTMKNHFSTTLILSVLRELGDFGGVRGLDKRFLGCF
jgi:hypothetical protein